MAKRFTDTDKWKRQWFTDLDPKAKLVWFYILDQCDHRGVWFENFKLLQDQTGLKVTRQVFENWFGSKVRRLDEDKYFIPSFVEFQYGELHENNNAHKAILQLLKKLGPHEPLRSPSGGAQDKEEDKDKESVSKKETSENSDAPPKLTPKNLMDFWNANRGDLPEALTLGSERLRHAKAQIDKYPDLEHWSKALAKFTSSQFCLTTWKPGFDDFLSESKRLKAIEGYYDRQIEPISRAPKKADPKPVNQTSNYVETPDWRPDDPLEREKVLDQIKKLKKTAGL